MHFCYLATKLTRNWYPFKDGNYDGLCFFSLLKRVYSERKELAPDGLNRSLLLAPEILIVFCIFSTPTFATHPVSLQGQTRDKLNRVFCLCWCTAGSSFPAGALQISFKISPYGNQTKWPLVIKHINWIDNHQIAITAKYDSQPFTCYREDAI